MGKNREADRGKRRVEWEGKEGEEGGIYEEGQNWGEGRKEVRGHLEGKRKKRKKEEGVLEWEDLSGGEDEFVGIRLHA